MISSGEKIYGAAANAIKNPDPFVISVLLLTLWGFVLRIYDLGYQSLWIDEGYSINAATSMLDKGLPILPSGYFYSRAFLNTTIMSSSMGVFGENEFAARLPSVIFGTLTIPLVFLLVKSFANKKIALITTVLITFSLLEIAWSRQARMYQQLQFFYLLSLYFFYLFTCYRSNRYLILTIISTICAILSHEFGFSLILVFSSYVLLVNIRNIRQSLLQRKILIIGLSVVALLGLGELLFNIISSVLDNRINYFTEYSGYLKRTFPVVLYMAAMGAIISFKKDHRVSLLLILAAIIPLYFITFHVKLLSFRYLFFLAPILFLFYSHAAVYISDLIPRWKTFLSPLIAGVILVLTLFTPGFSFTTKNVYWLEHTAPQPDFKLAYNFVAENRTEGDTIIDAWPAVGRFYLHEIPDYWLTFDIAGTDADYCVGGDKSREIYTNALCIKDTDMLKDVISENIKGWLIIDTLAWYRLPAGTTEFIDQNLIFYEEGSREGQAGSIKVYGWG